MIRSCRAPLNLPTYRQLSQTSICQLVSAHSRYHDIAVNRVEGWSRDRANTQRGWSSRQQWVRSTMSSLHRYSSSVCISLRSVLVLSPASRISLDVASGAPWETGWGKLRVTTASITAKIASNPNTFLRSAMHSHSKFRSFLILARLQPSARVQLGSTRTQMP